MSNQNPRDTKKSTRPAASNLSAKEKAIAAIEAKSAASKTDDNVTPIETDLSGFDDIDDLDVDTSDVPDLDAELNELVAAVGLSANQKTLFTLLRDTPDGILRVLSDDSQVVNSGHALPEEEDSDDDSSDDETVSLTDVTDSLDPIDKVRLQQDLTTYRSLLDKISNRQYDWNMALGFLGAVLQHRRRNITSPFYCWLNYICKLETVGSKLSAKEFSKYSEQRNRDLQLAIINALSSNKKISLFDYKLDGDGLRKALKNPGTSKQLKHFSDRKLLKRVAPLLCMSETTGEICERPADDDTESPISGVIWADPKELYHEIMNSRQAEPVQQKDDFAYTTGVVAKEHKYHPMRSFLDHCEKQVIAEGMTLDDAVKITSNLCSLYFRTTVPLYDKYLQKQFLEGAYMTYFPGHNDRCMTWFIDAPNCGKTGFIKAMAMGGNSAESETRYASYVNATEIPKASQDGRDDWTRFTNKFAVIYDEIDKIAHSTGSNHVDNLKSRLKELVSTTDISFRSAYGKGLTEIKRSFMLFATTNEVDTPFLNDKGIDRYQVIRIKEGLFDELDDDDHVDFDMLNANRERYWGAFAMMAKAGYVVKMTKADRLNQKELNSDAEQEPIMTQPIRKLMVTISGGPAIEKIQPYSWFTMNDVMDALEIAPKDAKRSMNDVSHALKYLGFKSKRKRVKGMTKLPKIWWQPAYNPEINSYEEYGALVRTGKDIPGTETPVEEIYGIPVRYGHDGYSDYR